MAGTRLIFTVLLSIALTHGKYKSRKIKNTPSLFLISFNLKKRFQFYFLKFSICFKKSRVFSLVILNLISHFSFELIVTENVGLPTQEKHEKVLGNRIVGGTEAR